MSNIVCFRNYMIVLDSVVVVNLLVFSIYVWVSNFDSTYSSKYSFVFSLLMIRAVGTSLFVFDLSLYLFYMITFYDKKYRARRYVKIIVIICSFSFGFYEINSFVRDWGYLVIPSLFLQLIGEITYKDELFRVIKKQNQAEIDGMIPTFYFPSNQMNNYYQNYQNSQPLRPQ